MDIPRKLSPLADGLAITSLLGNLFLSCSSTACASALMSLYRVDYLLSLLSVVASLSWPEYSSLLSAAADLVLLRIPCLPSEP